MAEQTSRESTSAPLRADLETEKLQLEIVRLRHPFRYNPGTWVSIATAIVAVLALGFQIRVSDAEVTLLEAELIKKEIELDERNRQLQAATAELRVVEEAAEKVEQSLADIGGNYGRVLANGDILNSILEPTNASVVALTRGLPPELEAKVREAYHEAFFEAERARAARGGRVGTSFWPSSPRPRQ